MKQQLLLIIIFVCAINSHAQEKKWTLNNCILYAVSHSSRVNNQKSTNSIYHQDYLEAIGQLLPHISGNTSAGFNFGRGVDEGTNTYIDVNSFSNNYGISASLTIFDGLANYTKVRIGRINKLKGKKELEDAKDMVAYETMEAFYNMIYNKELVRIAEDQLQESTKSLYQIKRMEELGIKGIPDVAEAEAKEAEDQYNLTKQKNLLIVAVIQLKEKMNLPVDEDLTIEGEYDSQTLVKVSETATEIYEESKRLNPKAQIAESDLMHQKLNYKASKGSLMPRISMGAGISTNFFRNMDATPYTSFNDQLNNKLGEYISFTLSIPIFSGFSRSASVKRAKAQMHIAEYNKDDILRKLYSDIEQAIADANGLVDEYHQAIKQREFAEIAHQVNLRKYAEGLIDPILLQTSSNRLSKAKAEEYRTQYMYHLKYKLVSYYKGEPLFVEN